MYRKKNGCSAEYSNSSLHCQGKRTFPCPTPTVSANVPGDEDDHQAPLESEPESSSFRPCPHRSESQPSPKAPTQQGASPPHFIDSHVSTAESPVQAPVISGLKCHRGLLRVQTAHVHPSYT